MTKTYTAKEVAGILSCSTVQVIRLAKAGAIKGTVISKPHSKKPRWRFTENDVEFFLNPEEQKHGARK